MPSGLRRFHESGQTHFVTFSCYRRNPYLSSPDTCDLFLLSLEQMRRRFGMRVYAYVVMPEHVHLLLSEPAMGTLADAIHFLKLSFSKRVKGVGPRLASKQRTRTWGTVETLALPAPDKSATGAFWEKRYYDRNVRDEDEFRIKLRYTHRNPVKRGLVGDPRDWKWSSFRHYASREMGPVEIESEWAARDREVSGSCGPKLVFLNSDCSI